MSTELCPKCGTARMGSFRYCRSCGLDYDSPEPAAPAATPAVLTPVAETAPDAASDPPPAAGAADVQPKAAGDVIVIQTHLLRLWAGLLIGGLVGAMLAGAVVVPFFGEKLVALGTVAGIATVVVAAWLGLKLVRSTSRH